MENRSNASNANCTKLMMNLQQALMKVADTNKDADFKLNWKRVAITSMFGLGFVSNVGHFWYLL
ncbi:BnaC09g51010D [Brassica napus]|uniref:BnaC09g51010D protein n=1 Tax=Brassica napus TaxID=3708 RepID=A0A078JHI8_BRANA|nr:BnaC09g51010D [Brassica napus]